MAPSAGLRYSLNNDLALEFDLMYSQYLSHDQIGWLEDLFGVSKDSEKWFPLTSKFHLQLGLVFNY